MDEDLELNRFVKGALEARPPFACGCAPEGRAQRGERAWHRRGLWWAASLLAASVALVAALVLPGREPSTSVDDALRLLTEAEGIGLDGGEILSPVELLLAWQEMPG